MYGEIQRAALNFPTFGVLRWIAANACMHVNDASSLHYVLVKDRHIRLLGRYANTDLGTLPYKLQNHALSSTPYAALWYHEDDELRKLKTVSVNSHTLGISLSLLQAQHETCLWVDAIPINREDIQERNRWVRHVRGRARDSTAWSQHL